MVDQGGTLQGSCRLCVLGWSLFCLSILAYLTQAWWIYSGHPRPGWFTDSVFYLALADFFSGPYTGAVSRYAMELYGTSRYPPLFPLSLAVGGGGLHNWDRAYAVCLTFGMLALVSAFLWIRQQTQSTFSAATLIPLAILSPVFFYLHLEILSESQFVTLLCLTQWLASDCRNRRTSITALIAVASLVALSRSVGLVVLVALTPWILFRLGHVRPATRITGATLMWIPTLAWMSYRRLFPVTNDYSTDLLSTLDSSATAPFKALLGSAPRLLDGYAAWFNMTGSGFATTVAAVVVFLTAIGCWGRIRDLHVDAVFLPLYLIVVSIWPYPAETARLLAITMPVVALHCHAGLVAVFAGLDFLTSQAARSALAAAALLIWTLAGSSDRWMDMFNRATAALDPELASEKRTISYFLVPAERAKYAAEVTKRFAELAKEASSVVGAGDCMWTSYYVMTGLLTDFRIRLRMTPQSITTTEEAREQLRSCRYLLAVNLYSPQLSAYPLYPSSYIAYARPVMLSHYSEDGKIKIAATLFDLAPHDNN